MNKLFKNGAAALLAAAMASATGISALADTAAAAAPAVAATTETTAFVAETSSAAAASGTTANGLPLTEDQRVLDFYKDSIVIGDSVADGFKLFAQGNKENPLMSTLQFQTASRYNLINALVPVEQDASIAHPVYQGKFMNVWDSVKLLNAKHVYLFFGFNDLGDRTSDIVDRYSKLISKIKEVNPDTDFTIISTTYIYPGYTKHFQGVKSWAFDNPTVRKLNTAMQDLSKKNGWGYMNIADRLSDGNGNLDPKYCSDQMIHQNADAYVVWAQCFRDYAASKNYTH